MPIQDINQLYINFLTAHGLLIHPPGSNSAESNVAFNFLLLPAKLARILNKEYPMIIIPPDFCHFASIAERLLLPVQLASSYV